MEFKPKKVQENPSGCYLFERQLIRGCQYGFLAVAQLVALSVPVCISYTDDQRQLTPRHWWFDQKYVKTSPPVSLRSRAFWHCGSLMEFDDQSPWSSTSGSPVARLHSKIIQQMQGLNCLQL
ncbi:unnamed protein product [Pieris macdunnoughi]|uniref:Uncharacterized protein n=1 Tax=Pieris macdunnoughi TaxID=345717 RepID=A0A821L1E4_9NEOP|nr:unnamed protein product [Pieris macdunnoughi]